MAVYILDGDVKFQTGQATTLLGSTDVYRFHVPSDATALTFFVAKTDRYKIPVYNRDRGAGDQRFDARIHRDRRIIGYDPDYRGFVCCIVLILISGLYRR